MLILLPQEHHDVRVGFQTSALTEVGQHRLGASGLDLPRQLRNRDDRHFKLARDRLQCARDLGDLLDPVVLIACRALDELEIVDDDEIERAALGLQTPRLREDVGDGEPRRFLDVDLGLLETARRIADGLQLRE